MSVVRSADIPDEDVVRLAVNMSARPHPSDLCRMIMEKFGCSAYVAGKAYSRVMEKQLIRQGKYDVHGQVRWYFIRMVDWEDIT